MTADEAKTLMSGTMEKKGLLFRTRIAWVCGMLNKTIENAVERGKGEIRFYSSKNFSEKYYPLLAQIYNDLGYSVFYNVGHYNKSDNEMLISWNLDSLPFKLLANFLDHYQYWLVPENIAMRYEKERIKKEKENGYCKGYFKPITNMEISND